MGWESAIFEVVSMVHNIVDRVLEMELRNKYHQFQSCDKLWFICIGHPCFTKFSLLVELFDKFLKPNSYLLIAAVI